MKTVQMFRFWNKEKTQRVPQYVFQLEALKPKIKSAHKIEKLFLGIFRKLEHQLSRSSL